MSTIWELDFYSRPVLDEQQKKLWEVVICEAPVDVTRSPSSFFRYAEFCSSHEINSGRLKQAIAEAMVRSGQNPVKVRFFRRQMTNMITKACKDLGINAQPSRRTLLLHQCLQERLQTVYPQMPGYQEPGESINPLVSAVNYESTTAQPLPDALMGQRWAFVTLEASAFADLADWSIDFGEVFPLSLLSLAPTTPIPGLVIFSERAVPLSAWISGLDLAFIKYEPGTPARLILETGVSDRWILATLPSPQTQSEAQAFETAKQAAQHVHFLAVQTDPRVERFAGFWLLQEVNLT